VNWPYEPDEHAGLKRRPATLQSGDDATRPSQFFTGAADKEPEKQAERRECRKIAASGAALPSRESIRRT
jgi:hypothetical protein